MPIPNIQALTNLSLAKQITFAYLACERVFPNYVYFYNNYSFGNPEIVRNAIDFIEQSIFDWKNINRSRVEYFLTAIYNNTPNTNDFTTFYATIAMCSGGVIFESVNLLRQADPSKCLSDISTMVTDAIDCFIQVRDDLEYGEADFEEKITNDPLMQGEIASQVGIICRSQNLI